MKDASYWKRYVLDADLADLERKLGVATFTSAGETLDLVHFASAQAAPSILISQGSGGHAYVFAELAYRMNARGYNVFIMPKHGGHTITELVKRHEDALSHIKGLCNERIGVFGEGLGAFVTFYGALAGGLARSIVCQNGPAILTESQYQSAVLEGAGGARRRRAVPLAKILARVLPGMKLPITSYLDFREMVDPDEAAEARLVEAYMHDRDFDRWYPLSASMSLLSTPPPGPLAGLRVPTMFIVPSKGFTPSYVRGLFARLPSVEKRIVEVDGSVFWMVSHSREAAKIISEWFDETIADDAPRAEGARHHLGDPTDHGRAARCPA